MNKFREQLEQAINSNCLENGSNTPDFILASYLRDCLHNFDEHVNMRNQWYKHPEFGVTTLKFGAYPGPIGEIWKPHFTIQYGE
jgi:hypothetical protein